MSDLTKGEVRYIREFIRTRADRVNYFLQLMLMVQGNAMFAETLIDQVAALMYGKEFKTGSLGRKCFGFTFAYLEKQGYITAHIGPKRMPGLDVLTGKWLGREYANDYYARVHRRRLKGIHRGINVKNKVNKLVKMRRAS